MTLESFFRILTALWAVGEILIAVFTTTWRGQGNIQDRGTQIMLWIVIVASVRISEWMHGLFPIDMPGSYSWLRPVAFGILLLGLGIRIVAIVTLGRAFSANVAMSAGQKLQRSGLYSLVRHPPYLGLKESPPRLFGNTASLSILRRVHPPRRSKFSRKDFVITFQGINLQFRTTSAPSTPIQTLRWRATPTWAAS
jgi:hypothetical protein